MNKLMLIVVVAFAFTLPVSAAVEFDLLFGDHAVLQREADVPIWGRGVMPGHEVRVTCGASYAVTYGNVDGTFRAILPAQPAGGPYELAVTADGQRAVSRDVYVGEVWLASGQSNMEFHMRTADPAFPPGTHPLIRMFAVPHAAGLGKVHRLQQGAWEVATPANVPRYSAVAGFFALKLQERLGCAVGILNSSWGGTRIEAWTSREALLTDPVARPWLVGYERSLTDPELAERSAVARRHNTEPEKRAPLDSGIAEAAKGWATEATTGDWREVAVPSSYAHAYGRFFNGAVWFRRTVELPADFVGKELVVHLGAIDKHDRAFFNGVQIGATGEERATEYWDKFRVYPVPAKLVTGKTATLAVRVWSFIYGGGMTGPVPELYLALKDAPTRRVPLSGRWQSRIERDLGVVFKYASEPLIPGSPNAPYTLFDSMIEPLLGYGIRGAIWYQGCANTSKASHDFHYGELMALLIRDWRYHWGQGDFPFIQVELANYTPPKVCELESGFAKVRQGQREATRLLPNVGLASAIDRGDAFDIHPKDKLTIGTRLAQWAFTEVYGLETVACGPRIVSSSIEGDAIRVRFTDCGTGLVAKGAPDGIVKPCAIAGEDGIFQPAVGKLDGNTLVIRSEKVKYPRRAVYGWASNPLGLNLYNREGLPASPFQTK